MKTIVLHISLTDDLKLKNVTFNYNDTGLNSSKSLLEKLSIVLLQSIEMDKHNDDLEELLNELKIKKIK